MSVPVALAALQAESSRFDTCPLLVTVSTVGPPHVASVFVTFESEQVSMRVGRRTRANADGHPAVTLVWPAGVGADYCLIVDAVAREGPTDLLVVEPISAVLHRVVGGSP